MRNLDGANRGETWRQSIRGLLVVKHARHAESFDNRPKNAQMAGRLCGLEDVVSAIAAVGIPEIGAVQFMTNYSVFLR